MKLDTKILPIVDNINTIGTNKSTVSNSFNVKDKSKDLFIKSLSKKDQLLTAINDLSSDKSVVLQLVRELDKIDLSKEELYSITNDVLGSNFGVDSDVLTGFLTSLGKMKINDIAIHLCVSNAILDNKFGNDTKVLITLARLIGNLNISDVSSQKNIMDAVLGGKFSNDIEVLTELATSLGSMNIINSEIQMDFLTAINENKFGDDELVLKAIARSTSKIVLCKMNLIPASVEAEICYGIYNGKFGYGFEVLDLLDKINLTDNIAQQNITVAILNGNFGDNPEVLTALATSIGKMNLTDSNAQQYIATAILNGNFGDNPEVLTALATSIGKMNLTDSNALESLSTSIYNEVFGSNSEVLTALAISLGEINFTISADSQFYIASAISKGVFGTDPKVVMKLSISLGRININDMDAKQNIAEAIASGYCINPTGSKIIAKFIQERQAKKSLELIKESMYHNLTTNIFSLQSDDLGYKLDNNITGKTSSILMKFKDEDNKTKFIELDSQVNGANGATKVVFGNSISKKIVLTPKDGTHQVKAAYKEEIYLAKYLRNKYSMLIKNNPLLLFNEVWQDTNNNERLIATRGNEIHHTLIIEIKDQLKKELDIIINAEQNIEIKAKLIKNKSKIINDNADKIILDWFKKLSVQLNNAHSGNNDGVPLFHNDIKLENLVFLKQSGFALIDWGMSLEDPIQNGTPNYLNVDILDMLKSSNTSDVKHHIGKVKDSYALIISFLAIIYGESEVLNKFNRNHSRYINCNEHLNISYTELVEFIKPLIKPEFYDYVAMLLDDPKKIIMNSKNNPYEEVSGISLRNISLADILL
ncbi:MAG: hypothetical protein LW807_05185 [Proteobacteria bacterium]|nr:hypothetical protein [Pseudomonadota bacterium]